MMLRTNVEEPKKIQKKEEKALLSTFKRKQIDSMDLKIDHLPFSDKITSIASKMPNHPKKPRMILKITPEYSSFFHL